MTSELTRRFDQPSLMVLQEMEDLLVDSCNGEAVKLSASFQDIYKDDLNFECLTLQLSMLPDLLRRANEKQNMGIKKSHLLPQCVKYLIHAPLQRLC